MNYRSWFIMLFSWSCIAAQSFDCLIITSNIDKAGTDAAVTLTLNGSTGLTYEKQVSGEFERDSWDRSLIIANTTNLGTITSVRVRHNNAGGSAASAGWHLGAIALRNRQNNQVAVFIADRWLATDEGDGKIDIVIPRSTFGWKTFTPPYAATTKWSKEVPSGTAKAVSSANKTTGSVGIFCDAWAGGATSVGEVGPTFVAPSAGKVFVRTQMVYSGGLVNAFIAAFSELHCSRSINSTNSLSTIQPAFTGQTVTDKVLSIASLCSGLGVFGAGQVANVIEALGTFNDVYSLLSGFNQLVQSGKATEYTNTWVTSCSSGSNQLTVGLRGVTTAMATGSSFAVVAGMVKQIEIVGGIPAAQSAPPANPAVENSGVPGSGMGRMITPK